MPRKRIHNKSLPKHWKFQSGAYYFVPAARQQHLYPKKWIRLGKTLHEAHKNYADIAIDFRLGVITTVQDLLKRYNVQVIPTKAPGTQDNNRRALKPLLSVFGEHPVHAIQPKHVYAYYDHRAQSSGPRTARAEIEVLRHAYTKAVEWGIIRPPPLQR